MIIAIGPSQSEARTDREDEPTVLDDELLPGDLITLDETRNQIMLRHVIPLPRYCPMLRQDNLAGG